MAVCCLFDASSPQLIGVVRLTQLEQNKFRFRNNKSLLSLSCHLLVSVPPNSWLCILLSNGREMVLSPLPASGVLAGAVVNIALDLEFLIGMKMLLRTSNRSLASGIIGWSQSQSQSKEENILNGIQAFL